MMKEKINFLSKYWMDGQCYWFFWCKILWHLSNVEMPWHNATKSSNMYCPTCMYLANELKLCYGYIHKLHETSSDYKMNY